MAGGFLSWARRAIGLQGPLAPRGQAGVQGWAWSNAGLTPALEAVAMRRRLATWQPAQTHINQILENAGETLISRARWMVRNNGYARAAVRSWSSAVVGPGIKPSSLIEGERLRKAVNEAFLRWTDEADAEDVTDFYGLQRRIARETFLAGECFVWFRYRRPSQQFIPLQLQMLPSEQLATGYPMEMTEEGNRIRMGIEFANDDPHRRVAYYFYRANPVDSTLDFQTALEVNEIVRVPADEVIHVFDPVEAGQVRGLSSMASAMVRLLMIDSYDDAELERKRQAARYATFIKRPENAPEGGLPWVEANQLLQAGITDQAMAERILRTVQARPDGELTSMDEYGPGATVVLYPGEEISFSNPADVGSGYEPFQYRVLLQICASLGVPYTELSSDLNRTTYASSRAGILAFRQEVEAFQHAVMVYQFIRKIWVKWMDAAVLAGRLPIPAGNYAADPARYQAMTAITPRAPWVDPLKDRQAEVLALRAGIKAPQDVIEAEGYNIEEVYQRIAEARELEEKLGIGDRIDYGWSARATQQQQQAPTRSGGASTPGRSDGPTPATRGSTAA